MRRLLLWGGLVAILLCGRAEPADAVPAQHCYPDVRAVAAGAAPTTGYTAWWGGRGAMPPAAGGTLYCQGDPEACWVDYYTNGHFERYPAGLGGGERWRSFTWVGPAPWAAGCAPLATPAATVWKTPELSALLHDRAVELRRQLVQARGMMAYFCTQATDPRLRAMCGVVTGIVGALTAQLVMAVTAAIDPPNPDYAALPALCALAPAAALTADQVTHGGVVALSPAQLSAHNSWVAKHATAQGLLCQAHATWEAASGAVLALQAGDSAAPTWARRLAHQYDVVMAGALGKASKERAARSAAFGALAPAAMPAACPNPWDSAGDRLMVQARLAGVPMLQAAEAAAGLTSDCATADAFPALYLASLADEAHLDRELAAVSLAETVCASTGACSSATLTTVAPGPKQRPLKIRQVVTVTCPAPCLYPVAGTEGLVAQVSVAGLMPTTSLALVDGAAALNVTAPAGTYQVCAVFPEQSKAKRRASNVACATAVVAP